VAYHWPTRKFFTIYKNYLGEPLVGEVRSGCEDGIHTKVVSSSMNDPVAVYLDYFKTYITEERYNRTCEAIIDLSHMNEFTGEVVLVKTACFLTSVTGMYL